MAAALVTTGTCTGCERRRRIRIVDGTDRGFCGNCIGVMALIATQPGSGSWQIRVALPAVSEPIRVSWLAHRVLAPESELELRRAWGDS